jgi:hypothetical protein
MVKIIHFITRRIVLPLKLFFGAKLNDTGEGLEQQEEQLERLQQFILYNLVN